MRASCVVALSGLLFACGSSGSTPDSGTPDSGTPDSGTPDSGTPDSSTIDTGSSLCAFVPSNLDLSKVDFTNVEDVVISHDQTIETDNGGLLTGGSGHYTYQEISQANGPKLGVFAVKSLTIPSGVNVTVLGADALVIVALGDITVAGNVYGNSREKPSFRKGPGATSQPSGTKLNGSGSGGGAAGSAASSAGGAGYCGAGGAGAALGGVGAQGGTSWGSPTLVPLVAGSNGGTGGVGEGGNGGGAIQLSACGSLSITGLVHLGGQGGWSSGVYDSVGQLSQQASGGGSGGSLLLEGTNVSVTGKLAANGGGGGGSELGADATGDDQVAAGGVGNASHAAGGDGAAGSNVDGKPGTTEPSATSGGGGGAAGRIRINSKAAATLTGLFSPPLGTCTTQGQP